MIVRLRLIAVAGLLFLQGSAAASDALAIYPPRVQLDGPRARQQLVVEHLKQGRAAGDLTAVARFSSSAPWIVEVTASGELIPRADGEARITAAAAGRKASAPVQVRSQRSAPKRSFRNDVLPLLTRAGCNSGACHGAAAGKGGLRLTLRGYDPAQDHHALTVQARARRVDRAAPARSLAIQKAVMEIPHGGGPRFRKDSRDYQVLLDWVTEGASGPVEEDPQITGIRIYPEVSNVAPGKRQQVLVIARYSDGAERDVTRWARWGSSADSVATVTDEGLVEGQGPGEAAITVWYSSKVGFARVVSPHRPGLAPAEIARAERRGKIDDLILARLQELGIPPSPPADDESLVRRAYLDLAGVLPSAKAVKEYLADRSPDRYERLVTRLLESPEYVDYWSYKWSDLLLVSSRKLQPKGLWSFHNWIRASVRENKPWDRFVREIVTATGSTVENGAANFYVLHKDPIDLTETTSQAFLGMAVTCARCHNHPLEKWTVKDYYGMANLFARVRLKNGARPGEMVVMPVETGDVPHLVTRKPVPPRPLDGEEMDLSDRSDRREHLADWLVSPENPYFSRAIVNRVWRALMGSGLVEAEDDLRLTNPPSNSELLDYLASSFADDGFNVRALISRIANSGAYRRASEAVKGAPEDRRYYATYVPRRLPAEVLLDAISQVTAVPTAFAGYPAGSRALQLADSQVASEFLTAFGRPERVQTCSCERQEEPNVAQALHLVNGATINDKLRKPESIAGELAKQDLPTDELLDEVYLRALSRYPRPEERSRVRGLLSEGKPSRELIEDLLAAVLTSREFLFNH